MIAIKMLILFLSFIIYKYIYVENNKRIKNSFLFFNRTKLYSRGDYYFGR